jgi:hypothetical protein
MIFGYPGSFNAKPWGFNLDPFIVEYRVFVGNDRGFFIGLSLYNGSLDSTARVTIEEVDVSSTDIEKSFKGWYKINLSIILLWSYVFYRNRIESMLEIL